MDLNICLYCEKQLLEESKSFCSSTCQSNEASKPVYITNNNLLFISSRSTTTTVSPTYEIAYRRRRYSSSYYPLLSSSSSSTSSSTCSYYSTIDHYPTCLSSHNKNVI